MLINKRKIFLRLQGVLSKCVKMAPSDCKEQGSKQSKILILEDGYISQYGYSHLFLLSK